jgi:(E)-4-hydroxy-3-methylbut-2-enyl-diphosphate synthase
MYINNFSEYKRRQTDVVSVGKINVGGNNPVSVQTMTNIDTNNVDECTDQIIRVHKEGADIVRLTTQGKREVESIHLIKNRLIELGIDIPVVADVHFRSDIADLVAPHIDKVRINPGNYLGRTKPLTSYSQEEYKAEIDETTTRFRKLIDICREHNTSIRIGSNHGSLSQRIVSRYGDTPEGMAEAAMEFLRIAKDYSFNQIIISMKSSNTRVMVHAYRILVNKMNTEQMNYPIHLGVTEAGSEIEGRIKSAVGIGTLLADGIGDTIRVSLTEEPENEIAIGRYLVSCFDKYNNTKSDIYRGESPINPYEYNRRESYSVTNIGGDNVPVVIADNNDADYICDSPIEKCGYLTKADKKYPLYHSIEEYTKSDNKSADINFIRLNCNKYNSNTAEILKETNNAVLILRSDSDNMFLDVRSTIFRLIADNIRIPVVAEINADEALAERFAVKTATIAGPLFIDGLIDGIYAHNTNSNYKADTLSLMLSLLQASRIRTSKTEFISCPGCGRTQFKLQDAVKSVREHTWHLKGLKIAVMGCIVNGPGEMADADYGYVGSGAGKITLYKGKTVMKKNINQNTAVQELINLIKEHGDWLERE